MIPTISACCECGSPAKVVSGVIDKEWGTLSYQPKCTRKGCIANRSNRHVYPTEAKAILAWNALQREDGKE